LITSTFFVNW